MEQSLIVRCLCLTVLVMACAIIPVYSAEVTVGLLAGNNKLGEVEEAAYAWAKDNFKTTTLVVDKSGNFKNEGTARQPEEFSVLWVFYTETDTLPEPFLADATKKAIFDYVEAGGSLFLSALALRYVVELDVEKGGDPRVFQPLGKDPPEIGVVPTADGKNHPVFEGFDTSKPIFLTSMQQNGFTSDFFNFGKDPEGTILGTKTRGGGAGGGERPFVEYEVSDGVLITLGHHNGVYTDAKSEEGDNLRKLTTNVLNYLGENSAFFAVDPNSKLAITWGAIKVASK
ncbi:MAG: DUF4960 domain-containing protein [Candidatus Poribacteria bacterium]|nr:DUF4960 domain-containing protein [Candidatus Poribacteria bacterium]